MSKNKNDLEERTTKFGKEIILFAKNLPRDVINIPLISQIVRSATSIGANYREATGASSRKDFKNKLFICKKEANETKHWLELIAETNTETKAECRKLWKEAQELTLIFSQAIITTEKKK